MRRGAVLGDIEQTVQGRVVGIAHRAGESPYLGKPGPNVATTGGLGSTDTTGKTAGAQDVSGIDMT